MKFIERLLCANRVHTFSESQGRHPVTPQWHPVARIQGDHGKMYMPQKMLKLFTTGAKLFIMYVNATSLD